MTFNLSFNLDNAAFQYNRTEAIMEILDQVKRKLRMGLPEYSVFDLAGNKVGRFEIISD